VSDGSGRDWLGVVIAWKADLNWKLQISNSSLTVAGLWRYGDWRRGHGLHRSSNNKWQWWMWMWINRPANEAEQNNNHDSVLLSINCVLEGDRIPLLERQ